MPCSGTRSVRSRRGARLLQYVIASQAANTSIMRASVAGLPDSRTTISTIRSCLSTSSPSARCTNRARSSTGSAAQAGCALRARSSAARTSAAVCTSISPIFSRVTGLWIKRRRRAPAGTSIGVTMAIARVYHRAVVRLWFLCSRRAELTHAQYAAHLVERHAPLALRHHRTLRGYALNLVDECADEAAPIDSLNLLEYDAFEDFATRNYDSPEGERIVTDDHARFLGSANGYEARALAAHGAPGAAAAKWICAL